MSKTATAILLLLIQPFVFFKRVLFHPDRHIPFDLPAFHTPLADYIAYVLRQGEWPLWDPNPYCGYPIHADLQAQLFYPPAWLAIAARNLSSPGTMFYWLECLVVLHVMLAGILAFAFARRLGCHLPAALFAGTAFQLGAFFASQPQHLGAICGTAWLPLAWWAVWELREQRFRLRWFALLSLALALSFLAGFAATTFVVFASTALWCLALSWRRIWIFAAAAIAAIPLVLVQLGPTIEWSSLSQASLRADWNHGAGAPLRALWTLVWPNYHGVFTPFDPQKFTGGYEFTFLYSYCGLAAIGFGLWSLLSGGKASRIFITLAAVFFVLQSGSFLPGFGSLFDHLPRLARGAIYMNFFLGAACLALVLGAALSVARLPARWAWLVYAATAIELIAVGSNRPMNSGEQSWRELSSDTQIGASVNTVREVEALARTRQPPWRLDVLDDNTSFTMGASLRRLPTPNGDNPFAPIRLLEIRRLFAAGNYWDRCYPVVKPESQLLSFLNVHYLLAYGAHEDPAALERSGWKAAGKAENALRFYRNDGPQARFFLVGHARHASSPQAALELLQTIDPRTEAIVENASTGPLSSSGKVQVLDYQANAINLQTESEGPSLLVSSESFHPGWRIAVDRAEVPVLRVNSAFRGAEIPAGIHRVEMRYQPRWFAPMLLITALSWIFALLALLK